MDHKISAALAFRWIIRDALREGVFQEMSLKRQLA